MRKNVLPLLAVLFPALCLPAAAVAQTIPNGAAIDAGVSNIVTQTHAKGKAIAMIDFDKPLRSYGPDPVFPDNYGPYRI
jgi:hypothetical protein